MLEKNIFIIKLREEIYDCEWFDNLSFDGLENISGCQGFVFDDDENVCIAKWAEEKNWRIIGGGKEDYDSTFEDTFIREVDEEADLDISNIKLIGCIKSTNRRTKETNFQLRYIAKVKKIKEQTIDPAKGEIPQRKFIKPEEFNKYCNWGESGEFQIKKALEKLKEIN